MYIHMLYFFTFVAYSNLMLFLLSPGNVVLHYKCYMTDKWLPNCEDAASYLSEEDKHGILVFKASDQCNS